MAFGKNTRGKGPGEGRGKSGGGAGAGRSERRSESGRAPKKYEPRGESGRAPKKYEPRGESGRSPKKYEPRGESGRAPKKYEPRSESGRAPKKYEPRGESGRAPKKYEPRSDSGRAPKKYEPRGESGRAPKKYEPRAVTDRPVKKYESYDDGMRPPKRIIHRDEVKKAFVPHMFYVWGRRPVEAYLAELASSGAEPDVKAHGLHIIVDKAGKAPTQLRAIVELAKSFGFSMRTHESEDEQWPISSDDGINHQRVCLKVPALRTYDVQDLVETVKEAKEAGVRGCVGVVCDQVQDPRNFGAVIRSAAFFDAKFVIFGKDRQALVTPHVIKASAGGAFQVKLCEVVNLSRAFTTLKNAGAWIVGAALEGAVPVSEIPADRPYVLVLGNEGRGLRQEITRQCDYLARIPGGGNVVDSLNVAVAAGVFLSALSVPVEQSAKK